jgi:hypothetical protein
MIQQEFLKKPAILIKFSNKESPQPGAGLEHLTTGKGSMPRGNALAECS